MKSPVRTQTRRVGSSVGNTERRQRVVDEIKRRIVLGQLRPGQRIVEAEITETVGVSRPTAREALNQLAHDGFLVQEAYRGLRVSDFGSESIMDTARLRVALDAEAIKEILEDQTGRRLDKLERVWETFLAVDSDADPLTRHEAHIDFHLGIWEAAENYLLRQLWPVVEAQMTVTLAYDQYARGDAGRDLAVHTALMSAIRTGDEAEIKRALEVHTIDSARSLALTLDYR